MFRILKLVLLASAANCAPATFIPLASPLTSSLPQPYFFITPQPQAQFQYQPLLRIQQPAAPATLSKIDSTKNPYVLLYPSAPQLPLVALRDEEGGSTDYWVQINQWFNEFQNNFNQNPAPVETGESTGSTGSTASSESSSSSKLDTRLPDITPDNMPSLMPASTMPLNLDKQRFYILSNQPQFYGNYATLQPASIRAPILAIQPLRARSNADTIPAENEKVEQLRSQEIVELPSQQAVVQPIQQLQLRSNIVEPLQRLEINQPQIPMVNNEPVPEVAAQELARFLEEARSQDGAHNAGNALNENYANKLKTEEKPLEEETSIAQAKPSAIAVSGKGGVSSSSPAATAVVGEGGLALASPSAISLSGDFEEEEKKLKQMEPFETL